MERTFASFAAALLLASAAAAQGASSLPAPRHPLGAGSRWRLRPDAAELTVREPRLALQAISARELMGALDSPLASTVVAIAGMPKAPLDSVRIQRRLEGLWTLRVPVGGCGATDQAIDVQAEVVATSGSPDRLAPQTAGEPEIDVKVVPLTPHLLSRQEDAVTYEGGVVLELDLSKVRTSGTYSGTLVLTVNHY